MRPFTSLSIRFKDLLKALRKRFNGQGAQEESEGRPRGPGELETARGGPSSSCIGPLKGLIRLLRGPEGPYEALKGLISP